MRGSSFQNLWEMDLKDESALMPKQLGNQDMFMGGGAGCPPVA